MSSPKQERDSDRESLTDWTLVDCEGTPDKTVQEGGGKDDEGDSGKFSSSTGSIKGEKVKKKKEKGDQKSKEEEGKDESNEDERREKDTGGEEEENEELSEDLISMGKRVQEIKASSGSDSSDIETLELPSPEDGYEDTTQGYSSFHSSLLSSSLSGFTFVEDADDGDVESLASSNDVMVLEEERGKAGAAGMDEETDLSLASSPSLPDDLPAIKPDTQYRHTPDKDLSKRLNVVVALTVACVLGLGLGHFLGWSSRSLWQENLNSAQVRRLRELQDDLLSCINSPPPPPLPPSPPTQGEAGVPEHLYTTTIMETDPTSLPSFIPDLAKGEAEATPIVESFVESLVVPFEEPGVVLGPGQQHHLDHQESQSPKNHRYTYHRHVYKESSLEPTFATLDLLYGSADDTPDPAAPERVVADKDQDVRILPLATSEFPTPTSEISLPTYIEDEIDSVAAQPFLPTKTQEPAISDKTTATATPSPTNTLPPPAPKLNTEHESEPVSGQHQEQQQQYQEQEQAVPQFAEVLVEEDASPLPPLPSPPHVAVENSQIIEALNLENKQLNFEITRMQQETLSPIKISGKDGKDARNLRERITRLLEDNEELRVAVMKQQFAELPEGDVTAFNNALNTNYKRRLAVGKLTHLGPDLTTLKVSANELQKENQELQKQVGKLRYQEQPLPQELNVVVREVDNLRKVVEEASKKKKAPPNYENAKMYLNYMSQILQTLHDFHEGSLVEKLDLAADVFEGLIPENIKQSPAVQHKVNAVKGKFRQLKASLAAKWETIKELSRPQHLSQVSRDTVSKMNRVVVNVVNKMKDIGQASIMKRGKASIESTATTLSQSLVALGDQFDKTWKSLEAEAEVNREKENANLMEDSDEDSDTIQVGGEEEEEEEIEEETAVDDGEEDAEEPKSTQGKDGTVEIKSHAINTAKKTEGGGGGGGRRGGGGGGRGTGGGDDKTDLKEEKESNEENAEEEEKPDGRRDKSKRRSRPSEKKEKKEEKKDKKDKGKEKQKKDKKEKDKKNSKKEKDDKNKDKKNKSKDNKELSDRDIKEDKKSRRGLGKKDEEDSKRYHKGHYNKYDKKQQKRRFKNDEDEDDDDDDDDDDDSKDDSVDNRKKRDHEIKLTTKHHLKKHNNDDDDDDDDDDGVDKYKRKYQSKVIHKDTREGSHDNDDDDDDDKKKGLLRHWEKPSRKNYRREYPGPKKAFIRRRGKNATTTTTTATTTASRLRLKNEEDESDREEWMGRRAAAREIRRKEEQKADWLFERAKDRSHIRETEHRAEWQFDRARDRKDRRLGGGVEQEQEGRDGDEKYREGRKERYYSRKHEDQQTHKGRYVRFRDDEDDDDDDDDDEFGAGGGNEYEFSHHHQHRNHHHYHHHHHQARGRGAGGRGGEYHHKHYNKKGKREWVIPNLSATGKTFYH